ncbi:MAG: hypothetical protein K2K75_09610 [Muribaculaceae bacterium]|nr:hypothetical protein [Muribaculaceae bacterium]
MDISENMMKFVREHATDDVNALRLKYVRNKKNELDFDLEFALLQIEARRKARQKLSGFLSRPDFIFPTLLSAEQASNETVAKFHASLVSSAESLVDLTAGLGIDDMSFALKGINVTALEIDEIKCKALSHNAKISGIDDKIKIINEDSIEYIRHDNFSSDVVFADPARRSCSGSRVHALSDCQPDVLSAMTDILRISPRLLVKSSPLLDLSLIRNTVDNLNHIYVVCFRGECKEVLIDIRKDSTFEGVTVVDLDKEAEISRFHTEFSIPELQTKAKLSDRKRASDYQYLYEPNSGVMKTGAWSTLTSRYPQLHKADQNTHIFLSDALYGDFPGRIMQIVSEPDKKALNALKGAKLNVVSRNHPLSSPGILSKFSLVSGSDRFLYAFKYLNTPTFLIAQSVK